MKTTTIILTLLLFVSTAFGSAQYIICGWQPGEIYFTGPIQSRGEFAGFYYSPDYGQTIELRDSLEQSATVSSFGTLLSDADENTIHRIQFIDGWEIDHLLSFDGGHSWEFLDSTLISQKSYAAGAIPGEIYRTMPVPNIHLLERSEAYGMSYNQCSCIGFPDSLGAGVVALGSELGEVYVNGGWGELYYSSDFAENFAYLGNIQQLFGINPIIALINGAQPGEVYAHRYENGRVWRISNYGTNADLIMDYGVSCPKGLAVTSNPGEMYYYFTNYVECIPDPYGIMQIWHTTDYFQTWTEYEHIIDLTGIESEISAMPSEITLQVWPNPANPSFTIEYDLQTMQIVELSIFNLLGRQLWQCQPGIQLPGNYQIFFDGASFPSGTYILTLQTNERRWNKRITILK